MSDTNVRLETVTKLSLKPNDVLLVRLGGDLHDGKPPWIPSFDDMDDMRKRWEEVVPEGVQVLVTNYLLTATVVRGEN